MLSYTTERSARLKHFYAIAGTVLLVAFSLFVYSRWQAKRSAEGHNAYLCVHNLRLIDVSKEAYAYEHGLKAGDLVSTQVLVGLHAWPVVCPSGGTYSIGPVGTPPTCTVSGHKIP